MAGHLVACLVAGLLFVTCCKAIAMARCHGRLYDMGSHLCCGQRITSRITFSDMCCGKALFDYRVNVCCEGRVRRKPLSGVAVCCGTDVYDDTTQICCAGHVRARSRLASACCGVHSIDLSAQVCCAGHVVVRRPTGLYRGRHLCPL